MASIEYERISKAIEIALGPNKRMNRTASKIKEQKALGNLDYKFKKFIKEDFKTVLTEFIEILEEPSLMNTPNYRKLVAYKDNDFMRLFESYGYELGSWLTKDKNLTPENNRSFFNFPLFFKESCRKCSVYKYANMSVEEIDILLSNFIDLKHAKGIRPRKDRDNIEDEITVIMHTESSKGNMYNTIAEEDSYDKLCRNNRTGKVERVSKDIGTGFGFDLLNIEYGIETVVVIKACDNQESFLLSRTEYEAMINASKNSYSNLLIHKYLFEKDSGHVRLFTSYRYDSSNDVLVDVNDESNICNIERKDFTGKNGRPKVSYVCTPVKFKYVIEEPKTFKHLLTPDKNSNN